MQIQKKGFMRFGSATGMVITVSLPKGLHTLTLLVEDGKGGNDLNTVVIDVVDDTPPDFILTPAPISIEQSSGAGTVVDLPSAIAIDNCGNVGVTSDAPAVFPLGTTTVTFTATDASGNRTTATTTVTVVDTIPPSIINLAATPNTLSPPNHKRIPVILTASVADICDAAPTLRIISVAANEGSSSDWEITGNLTVNLRAERSGKGDRIYTITVQAMDASGNPSLRTVAVIVPHDQGK
jgi:hypothetical protein